MITCSTCEHAVYCRSWGEYKCKYKSRKIYDPNRLDCKDYKKKKPGPLPKCNCKTCLERPELYEKEV